MNNPKIVAGVLLSDSIAPLIAYTNREGQFLKQIQALINEQNHNIVLSRYQAACTHHSFALLPDQYFC